MRRRPALLTAALVAALGAPDVARAQQIVGLRDVRALRADSVFQAFDRTDFRQVVVDQVAAELPVVTIVERVDERIRALEQLPPAESRVVLQREPAGEPRTIYQNGVCGRDTINAPGVVEAVRQLRT